MLDVGKRDWGENTGTDRGEVEMGVCEKKRGERNYREIEVETENVGLNWEGGEQRATKNGSKRTKRCGGFVCWHSQP